jgi:nucleoside-diphosphate-sugar epimerase
VTCLFIFGVGYCGLEIARRARAAGWQVAGTVRDEEKARQYTAEGIETHLFDGTAGLAGRALESATHVLCTIAPGSAGDPALRVCAPQLGAARWFGYLSTTGVYGDHAGGWVDETTPARPGQPRSIERLAAERAWQAMGLEIGAAVDIFRLPGIYGPGRSAFDRLRTGSARRIAAPGQVFSRIHVDDLAAGLAASIARPRAGAAYNLCDDEPAPNSDVIAYAAGLLGMEAPPEVALADAALSPAAMRFYAESKRVSNARAKAELGWRPAYPTYREGLAAILAAGG